MRWVSLSYNERGLSGHIAPQVNHIEEACASDVAILCELAVHRAVLVDESL
jgi:hypothetical protein